MRHPQRPWWRRVSEWFGSVQDDRPAPRRLGRDPWYRNDHAAVVNARSRRAKPTTEQLLEIFDDLLGGGRRE